LDLAIDLSAMAGIDNDDGEYGVVDPIEHPVVAAAHPPFSASGEFPGRRGARVVSKEFDDRLHATLRFWREFPDRPGCDGEYVD
jgi:hypothetical protein